MRAPTHLTVASTLLAGAALAGFLLYPAPRPASAGDAPTGGVELKYHGLPGWFRFQPKETINRWVAERDTRAMTEHAWLLWAAITSPTDQKLNGQTVPVFETWYDRDETLAANPPARRPTSRKLEPPRQLVHARRLDPAAPRRPASTLFQNVKYNEAIYRHVRANRYYQGQVLHDLNASWGDAPIADRKLKDFPDTSVMLKPVFQGVSGTAPTKLPYWTGPANSTAPSTPDVPTWTKSLWLLPPGMTEAQIPGGNAEKLPVVPLSRFYAIRLDAEEAKALGIPGIGAGDYAILNAMHVSSREIDNWTWQTFFWSFNRPTLPPGVKSRVRPPFDNYEVAVAYSFTEASNPDGLNVLCFNPYLEAGFGHDVFAKPGQLGIESNCMSCHRCAAWPGSAGKYIANGTIDPGDPFFFTGNTKTDFLWGIPFGVKDPGNAQ